LGNKGKGKTPIGDEKGLCILADKFFFRSHLEEKRPPEAPSGMAGRVAADLA
jgi:hypothetical protein